MKPIPNEPILEVKLNRAVDAILQIAPPTNSWERARQLALTATYKPTVARLRLWSPVMPATILAASILIVCWVWLAHPADSFAAMQEALRNKPWIHLVSKDSKKQLREIWISYPHGIMAVKGTFPKSAMFWSAKDNSSLMYDPIKNVITRSKLRTMEQQDFTLLFEFFSALQSQRQNIPSLKTGMTVKKSQRRELVQDKQVVIEYEICMGPQGDSPDKDGLVNVQIDQKTNLPTLMSVRPIHESKASNVDSLSIDYPIVGPEAIYSLGVPQDAKMVDLTLPSELQKLADQMNKQVEHFPAYRAIIVRGQPKVNWHDSYIEMIFREGRKYRQELLPESLSRVGVPKHVFATDDLNEWASKEWDKYKWMTLVVSKGNETAVAEYSLRPNEKTPIVQFKPSRVITASSSIRFYLPRMSPELICYPDLSFANGMACTIQPNCLELAFPTTKVEVRCVTQDLSDNSGIRYYCYWFDPKRGLAAVQWERCSHLPEENPTTGTYSREKYRIEEHGKTSEGVWFPLRVIYSIQNKNEPVYESWIRYCLDFSPQDSRSIYEFKERTKK